MLEFSAVNVTRLLGNMKSQNLLAASATIEIMIACFQAVPSAKQKNRINVFISSLQTFMQENQSMTIEVKLYNFQRRNYPSMRMRGFGFVKHGDVGKTFEGCVFEFGWYTYDTKLAQKPDVYQVEGNKNPVFVYAVKDGFHNESRDLTNVVNERFNNYWNEGLPIELLGSVCEDCKLHEMELPCGKA